MLLEGQNLVEARRGMRIESRSWRRRRRPRGLVADIHIYH
jgi:hypothetical protein